MRLERELFDEAPRVVIWEMSRACALNCVHCRAEAVRQRDPNELDEREAFALLRSVQNFGTPLVVLTGGDPMRRPDIFRIVEYGASLGLRMAVTPSATGEMTLEKVRRLKDAGLARLAVSLDGPVPEIHDAFRQVSGSYGWTLDILRWAQDLGLPAQINTTLAARNIGSFEDLSSLMESLKIELWSVFFLVPVGRAEIGDGIRGMEFERVFDRMHDLSKRVPFRIKSTEAPHYRRFVIQKGGRPSESVNDGKGFVFISHTGEIYPSGFLPLSAGNVRVDSLESVYRDSPMFKELRDPSKLRGKCGACEYRNVCGGSRARAWNVFGDYLEAEPFCVHVPKNYEIKVEEERFW